MEIKTSVTMGNHILNKVNSFGGIDVYQVGDMGDDLTLIFTKGKQVLKQLTVLPDCGQNIGYISEYKFIEIEE
jgi:hypothetical protein